MDKIVIKGRYSPVEQDDYTCTGPSMVRPEFADQCDLSKVIQHYEHTGQFYNAVDVKHMSPREGVFIDVSDIGDYEAAQRVITTARDRFMELPAAYRAAFENSPLVFAAVVNTPGMLDKYIEQGLIPDQFLRRGAGDKSPANAKPEAAPASSDAATVLNPGESPSAA